MATTEISLSATVWTRLTAAGESGTTWKKTGGQVVVDHTDQEGDATVPLTSVNITVAKSKRVPLDGDNNDVLALPADNANDVYYALSLTGDTDKITVDAI